MAKRMYTLKRKPANARRVRSSEKAKSSSIAVEKAYEMSDRNLLPCYTGK